MLSSPYKFITHPFGEMLIEFVILQACNLTQDRFCNCRHQKLIVLLCMHVHMCVCVCLESDEGGEEYWENDLVPGIQSSTELQRTV